MRTPKKLSSEKEKLATLHGAQKIQYIWDYYKLPIVVICIFMYILCYFLYRHFTHKETVLYTALVNVVASDSLTEQLSTGFLNSAEFDSSKNDLQLYTGLYLTNDEANPYYEYTYASRVKILALIDSEQLDVVLMNREAFDIFSQNGYLCNLEELLYASDPPDIYTALKPYFVTNLVILEDNYVDAQLDPSIPYQAITEEYVTGIDLSQAHLIRQAGFDDIMYLGIIDNSTHKSTSSAYIEYLFSEVPAVR